MSVGDGAGGGSQVKSAVRTVELLEFFAGRPGMHSLAAVQEAVGYPKSSLYMLLRTLVDLGWIETDATGTRYGIGVRALLVGTSYIDGDEVVAAARPALDRLAEDTAETIHLARLDGTSVVYLATRQSQHYLRPFTRVGRRLPAHSTSLGKALLATHSDEQVRAMLPPTLQALTEHTITDRESSSRSCGWCASAATRWTARRTRWGCAASARRSPTAPPRGTPSAARCRSPGSPRPTNRPSRTPCSTPGTG